MNSYALPSRQLVSQADAAHIEPAGIPRSRFINQWTRKTNFDAGFLIPILIDEVLPGDHMQYNVTAYVRMQTPIFPQFDNIRIDTFFFFVPNRLVWDNWVRFMGQQDSVGASTAYTVPVINDMTLGGEAVNSIFDHMGIPVAGQITAGQRLVVNALPFRAYNLIFNEWFRDENIMNAMTVTKGDGPDSRTLYFSKRRAKAPDYFTSALPWPQKFTAPTVPIGGLAPVIGIGKINQVYSLSNQAAYETPGGAAVSYPFAENLNNATGSTIANTTWAIKGSAAAGGYPQIYADLAQTTGVAINTLRQAWLIQQLLERDARGGTRYTEIIRSHFGAISPDFRLQRPEYIGGGQSPLSITPIAQTAPVAGVGLGVLGGAGTAAGTHSASYAATEHGFIIGLINARAETSYQQGLHKMWSRSTRFDYYWPALAGLGEQAITFKEIYALGTTANDDAIFGYQERWHEYRTRTSEVIGIMRSTAAGNIDEWHLAQQFSSLPTLNSTFIASTPPASRVLAGGVSANGMQVLFDSYFQIRRTLPLPTYSVPGLKRF